MSALPKEVQRQARKAEAAHAKVYGTGEPEAPVANDTPTDIEAAPAPVAVVPTNPEAPAQPTEAAPASSLETPAEPFQGGQEPSKKVEEAEDRWEHKYNVLNGKYKAEVPRLHKQIRELGNELSSLQGLIASLEKASPAAVDTSAPTGERLLKDEEIDDYGEELVSVMKRAAREEIAPELERLQTENAQLKAHVGAADKTRAGDAREAVFDALNATEGLEDWMDINESPEYLRWLQGVDVYSGMSRQDMLSDAFKANDAARVVTFFKGYLKENAAVQPETPEPVARQPQVDMEALAAPGAPKASATRAPEGKRMWKQKEISAFYREVQKGTYRGKDSEKHRIEQDIIKAGQEGRITA